MEHFPVIISFYTKETPYEKEVENLIASCERFGLEHSIEGVESFGTRELNCTFKPFFLLQKLQELKKPLLWIDADGVVVQKPKWQEAFAADLAVRMHPELADDHRSKVITSTVFIRPTDGAKVLLKLWIKQCQETLLDPNRTDEFWDQTALRDAILKRPSGISVSALPLSYAKIFDHPTDRLLAPEPVIEHFQASRRFKKSISLGS
ncbi:MAG: hypothetical protein KR126chlam1_00065 [Chlamydiae bacterium]|nr:hypothetical protein [Chlamydiota bacterium]